MMFRTGDNKNIDGWQTIQHIAVIREDLDAFKCGDGIMGFGHLENVHRLDAIAEPGMLKDVVGSCEFGIVGSVHNQKGDPVGVG